MYSSVLAYGGCLSNMYPGNPRHAVQGYLQVCGSMLACSRLNVRTEEACQTIRHDDTNT